VIVNKTTTVSNYCKTQSVKLKSERNNKMKNKKFHTIGTVQKSHSLNKSWRDQAYFMGPNLPSRCGHARVLNN